MTCLDWMLIGLIVLALLGEVTIALSIRNMLRNDRKSAILSIVYACCAIIVAVLGVLRLVKYEIAVPFCLLIVSRQLSCEPYTNNKPIDNLNSRNADD